MIFLRNGIFFCEVTFNFYIINKQEEVNLSGPYDNNLRLCLKMKYLLYETMPKLTFLN